MSKQKRQKKATQTAAERLFAQARSEIAANGNIRVGLVRYKAKTSLRELRQTLPLFSNHPSYRSIISPEPTPKDFSTLGRNGLFTRASFANEIVWNSRLILPYSNTINRYLELRCIAEDEFLLGNYPKSSQAIDQIERECGASVWLAELKISTWHDTLTAKDADALCGELMSTKGLGDIPRFVISLFHFRFERDLTSNEFSKLIDRVSNQSSGFSNFLKILLGETPHLREDDVAFVLAYGDQMSILDRYLLFKSCAQILVASNSLSQSGRAILLEELSVLESVIQDQTLSRLIAVLGAKPSRPPILRLPLALIDLYTKGEYNQLLLGPIDLGAQRVSIDPLVIQMKASFYRADANHSDEHTTPFSENECALNQIKEDISSVVSFSAGANDAVARLTKISANHSESPWAAALALFLSRARADHYIRKASPREVYLALRQDTENPLLSVQFSVVGAAQNYLEWAYSGQQDNSTINLLLSSEKAGVQLFLDSAIDAQRAIRLSAARYLNENDSAKAVATLASWRYCQKGSLFFFEGGLLLAEALLRSGQLQEAADVCVDLYLESDYTGRLLPIKRLTEALIEKTESLHELDHGLLGQLPIVILFDLYSRIVSSKLDSEKADAFKDFLIAYRIKYASNLGNKVQAFKRNHLIYFFRNVCTPNVLDQSYSLTSTREVEDERAKILLLVNDLTREEGKTPSPQIMEELREIRTKQVVRKATQQLDQSRIYVNVDGIKRNLHATVRESWQYYRLSNLQADLDQTGALNALVSRLNMVGVPTISIGGPLTERDAHLIQIIYEIRDLFATSKEFGLDANLSTNVRHGYVMRELRASFVKENLVTNKSSEEEGYRSNSFWLGRDGLGLSDTAELDTILKSFSGEIDKIIEHLNRVVLRIKSDSISEGLFDFTVSPTLVRLIRERCSTQEKFEDFIDAILDTLWNLTENSLENVQYYLSHSIKQEFNDALEKIQSDLNKMPQSEGISSLRVAVTRVRPEINAAVDRVKSWFVRPSDSEFSDFNLSVAFEAGLATVSSYFTNLDMSPNFEERDSIVLAGSTLPTFARIFTILVENAALHSGTSQGKLNLRGRAFVKDNVLSISVINALDSSVDREKVNLALFRINARFNQEGAEGLVANEGDSGFPKIWRLLTHDLRRAHSLDVSMTDDGDFKVDIQIDARGILR